MEFSNDYNQHFVDTLERPQNFVREPPLMNKVDELGPFPAVFGRTFPAIYSPSSDLSDFQNCGGFWS